ncbi:MAG: hypothetical protein ACREM1_10080 [Longimicrobiales bacterium]
MVAFLGALRAAFFTVRFAADFFVTLRAPFFAICRAPFFAVDFFATLRVLFFATLRVLFFAGRFAVLAAGRRVLFFATLRPPFFVARFAVDFFAAFRTPFFATLRPPFFAARFTVLAAPTLFLTAVFGFRAALRAPVAFDFFTADFFAVLLVAVERPAAVLLVLALVVLRDVRFAAPFAALRFALLAPAPWVFRRVAIAVPFLRGRCFSHPPTPLAMSFPLHLRLTGPIRPRSCAAPSTRTSRCISAMRSENVKKRKHFRVRIQAFCFRVATGIRTPATRDPIDREPSPGRCVLRLLSL